MLQLRDMCKKSQKHWWIKNKFVNLKKIIQNFKYKFIRLILTKTEINQHRRQEEED